MIVIKAYMTLMKVQMVIFFVITNALLLLLKDLIVLGDKMNNKRKL